MKGISTRFIIKAIDNAITTSEHNCLNPLNMMESLIKSVKEMDTSPDEKKKYLELIQDTMKGIQQDLRKGNIKGLYPFLQRTGR